MGDGGDIEFVSLEDDIVYVRLLGACVGCSLIDVTLNNGIKNWIMEEIPTITDVIMVQDTVDNSDLFSF
ncbi:MAG: NifU family protein [Erysipelotrichaceae bacterium]|nr:NifU family protein [Erysipelotrichaceae bacterium]